MSLYSILRDREIGNGSDFQKKIENNTIQNIKDFKFKKSVFQGHEYKINALKVRDSLIVTAALNCIRIWDFESCKLIKEFTVTQVDCYWKKLQLDQGRLMALAYDFANNAYRIYLINVSCK